MRSYMIGIGVYHSKLVALCGVVPAPSLGWLLLGWPLTAIPLLLFSGGACRIPMAPLGILRYISPSLQMLLGVWLYGEAFDPARPLGIYLIWLALAVYSVDGVHNSRSQRSG